MYFICLKEAFYSSVRVNTLAGESERDFESTPPAGIQHFMPEFNIYKVLFYIARSSRDMRRYPAANVCFFFTSLCDQVSFNT